MRGRHYTDWHGYELWVFSDMEAVNNHYPCLVRRLDTQEFWCTGGGFFANTFIGKSAAQLAELPGVYGPFDNFDLAKATVPLVFGSYQGGEP